MTCVARASVIERRYFHVSRRRLCRHARGRPVVADMTNVA
jgi:hypothetical protein